MKFHYLLAAVILLTAACSEKADRTLDVVPYPNEVRLRSGNFDIAGATFHLDENLPEYAVSAVADFARQLSKVTGKESAIVSGSSRTGVVLIVDPSLKNEEYHLETSLKAIVLKASGLNGFLYGLTTLRQMLPVEFFSNEPSQEVEWVVPCSKIIDSPRFSYRGMHLDVARHFFSVNEVKKYLDVMAMHKLNRFHWHLTDDQGWRIEIKKYPELTAFGSIRKETIIGHLYSEQGYDGTPYGEGLWYTQDQIREVVSYAASLGITIVPEIDLPGHMVAALACYPELGCTGGPYSVWTRWGVADDVLCPGKEATFDFIFGVLDEILELFPSEYIHIGGDECPKVRWEKCPDCQARIAELGLSGNDKHAVEFFLQSYVTERVGEYLAAKGRKIIGWDEILEGKLAPNATVMSWRGIEGGVEAARLGHDAIMTPYSHLYFDFYQSENKDAEPLAIGGYSPVEKVYSYEPYAEGMTKEETSHIIGVQANLWTEYITTDSHLEYMLLPRLAALSEVQWCKAEKKDWNRFLESLPVVCQRYGMMGYNYATHCLGQSSVSPEAE